MSRKRSRSVSFSVATLSTAAALAGCGQREQVQQAQVYGSVAQCKTQTPGAACDEAWQASVGEHQRTAPQYSQQAQCEAQYGAGHCQTLANPHGGGSVFIPIMTGFMLGQMMSGRRREDRGWYSHPVYTGGGGLFSGGRRIGDAVSAGGRLPPRVSVPVGEGGALGRMGSTVRGGFGRMGGFRGGFGG